MFTRKGKVYWPQGRFTILPGRNNKWECPIKEENLGDLSVLIAKVDPGTHLWIRHYSKVGREKHQWVGFDIESLPDSIKSNAEVTFRVIG